MSCRVLGEGVLDLRHGIIRLGRAPHIFIRIRRRREGYGYRLTPEVYRGYLAPAPCGERGTIQIGDQCFQYRFCNRIRRFYLCYAVNGEYCARRKRSGNIMYDMRVCIEVTEGELSRFGTYLTVPDRVLRLPEQRRRATIGAAIRSAEDQILRNMFDYINALVYRAFVDRIIPRGETNVDVDAAFAESLVCDAPTASEVLTFINALEVLPPVIKYRDTGTYAMCTTLTAYLSLETIVEEPLPYDEQVYVYRCRCPQFLEERGVAKLTSFMDIERGIQALRSAIFNKFIGPASEIDLERLVYEIADAVRATASCRLATYEDCFGWLHHFHHTINSTDFKREAMRRCGVTTRVRVRW